jgi:hypothetical protein
MRTGRSVCSKCQGAGAVIILDGARRRLQFSVVTISIFKQKFRTYYKEEAENEPTIMWWEVAWAAATKELTNSNLETHMFPLLKAGDCSFLKQEKKMGIS